MSLTILKAQVQPKQVVLVDTGYPYGKKPYMSGPVVALAAQLMAAGHQVEIVDFNIDSYGDNRVRLLLSNAEVIGVSVMGSPGIPNAIQLVQKISRNYPRARVVVGGQVISHLSNEQFARIFGPATLQAANENDVAQLFGAVPSAYEIHYQPVWEKMGDER